MIETATWTVLLVEDNMGDVHLMRMCMDKCPGIVLHTVPNAVQAHQFLRRKPPFEHAPTPDLVLLDLRMPIYDGTSVLEGIRTSDIHPKPTTVVFTSSRLLGDQARCKKLGAHDYVTKPTDWPEWESTIQAVLRKHLKGYLDQ